jgi:4-hydroxyproline betaine 2-epimerase
LKISHITLWKYPLGLSEPYSYSGARLTNIPTLIARVETDDGFVGWGESCPLGPTYQPAHALGGVAAVRVFAPTLIGTDALPRILSQRMDLALEGHAYAKALIDIAAWDILGKRAGLPLHQLLGGALMDKVPSYYAIAPSEPSEARATAKKYVDQGFRAFQLKIGSGDLDQDAASIRAVWEILPSGVSLAADANRALLAEEAIHLSKMVGDIPIAFEQPCNSVEEMRSLKGRLKHPLYWDESTTSPTTVIDALGQGYCDGLGMKITRVGGISAILAVRDMAIAKGVKLSVDDSWGGDIIAAACTHVGATVPPRLFRGTWLAKPYLTGNYGADADINILNGFIDLPTKPGLGIEPDVSIFGDPVFEIGSN